MKPWKFDLIVGIIITTGTGVAIATLLPVPILLLWCVGVLMGYGLRIGIVNMWPHIFKPRLAYKSAAVGKE